MKKLLTATTVATLAASPAFAAGDAFFSLRNTDFVVLIAFIIFIAILIYFNVPSMVTKMLDQRAENIGKELDEAKALREEAQSLLASYERKQKEVQEQADRIVENARAEATRAADQAKEDIRASVARRLAAAEDQIASAQASAVKEVRDEAVTVAIGAAREVIAKQMTASDANKLIDKGIADAGSKLH
ncbi:F0F1 ATP synthase subunit B [Pelagovum pacificum]|uniref:ATP synthase subunit b n=1 Tax=Pelagovum pacificum TaxID=2588711 RepID=A0A5C5GH63_9RHOB|nr:F0F1 ATP synthase subunit B [Pelagovum pacificum]QQA43446.1 F0F1 ATP synthase subunit B [Pelagovum pacificum]TNY33417.1 F0F1 ATP synthase subunit B [Pelagovum pacificum]